MNADFRVISKTDKRILDIVPLDDAVLSELLSIGFVLFVLIGQIHDTQTIEVPVKSSRKFKMVQRNPQAALDLHVSGDSIILREVLDIDSLCSMLAQQGEVICDDDRMALALALDRLSQSTELLLTLPDPSLITHGDTLLDHLLEALIRDIEGYQDSLSKITSSKEYNNILRISYNFATETLNIIKLIVSLCDLKPVVLWCTVREHIALQSAISNLPWGRLGRKASLKGYSQLVKDARNQAFHHTFSLNQRIRVDLSDKLLEAQWLTMFSPHTKKGENKFVFKDKELIELLTGFTSAPKRVLPPSFWTGNLNVLNATKDLLSGTRDALILLAE